MLTYSLAYRNNIIKLFLEIDFGLVHGLCEWSTRSCTTDVFPLRILTWTLSAQRQLGKEIPFLYFYVTVMVSFSSKRPSMFQSLSFQYSFVNGSTVTWVATNNLVHPLFDQEKRPVVHQCTFYPWRMSITLGQHQYASELGISAYNHLINAKLDLNAQSNLDRCNPNYCFNMCCEIPFMRKYSLNVVWFIINQIGQNKVCQSSDNFGFKIQYSKIL